MKKHVKRRKKERKIRHIRFVIIIAIGLAIYISLSNYMPPKPKLENKSSVPESALIGKSALIDNRTVQIKQNDYYAYPIILYQNQTIHVYLSAEGDKINTLFLASSQFENYKNLTLPSFKSIKYFVEASFWGVRGADFRFTPPEDDTYYLLLGKKVLIKEQAYFAGNATVDILVYKLR